MGGLAGFLDGAMNAVGQAGVSLKSKRDYDQESARFDAEQAQAAARLAQAGADLTYANQENATRADKLTELGRKRAWEAEDRAAIQEYIRGISSAKGWQPPVASATNGPNVRRPPAPVTPLRQSSIGIPVPVPGSAASPAGQQKPFETILGPLQPGYSAGSSVWRDPLAARE